MQTLPAGAAPALLPRAAWRARAARAESSSTSGRTPGSVFSKISLHRRPARTAAAAAAPLNGTSETVSVRVPSTPGPMKEWHSRALVNDGRVFSELFPVRFDEVGTDGSIAMSTLAGILQECACNHAQCIWRGNTRRLPPRHLHTPPWPWELTP
jgi:fatty acyl-ACP thioesterase A